MSVPVPVPTIHNKLPPWVNELVAENLPVPTTMPSWTCTTIPVKEMVLVPKMRDPVEEIPPNPWSYGSEPVLVVVLDLVVVDKAMPKFMVAAVPIPVWTGTLILPRVPMPFNWVVSRLKLAPIHAQAKILASHFRQPVVLVLKLGKIPAREPVPVKI